MNTAPNDTAGRLLSEKIAAVFKAKNRVARVLLVSPLCLPERQLDVALARNKRYYNYPPYGLGLLCANLKKRGYEARILDLNCEVLAFVNYGEPSGLNEGSITAAWKDSLKNTLASYRPDAVGINCTFTMTGEMLMKAARVVKEFCPGMPVIAGGVHSTNSAEAVLREESSIDFICRYESDATFPGLLEFVNGTGGPGELSQVAALVNGEYAVVERYSHPSEEAIDIRPDYGGLDVAPYSSLGEVGTFRCWLPEGRKGSTLLTNRGCRGRCTFCSVHNYCGKGVRARSIGAVADEIEALRDNYGINHITFLDDDLFFDDRRALRLFGEIVRRKLDITWDATNGIIASSVSACPELIDVAEESGCVGMYFGIESGNSEILKRMRKPSGVKHYLDVGRIMLKHPGIFTKGFLIIGFPGETVGQMNDTVKLSRDMALDWNTVSLLTPLPSTELYEKMFSGPQAGAGETQPGLKAVTKLVGYGYNVRHGENRRIIEKKGETSSRHFAFDDNPGLVPDREELNDLWLIMDYRINYEKLLGLSDPLRLRKAQRTLKDVCDRMTVSNPLANLFLGIVEGKLGGQDEKQRRFSLSGEYLAGSVYWKGFFDAMEINSLYDGGYHEQRLKRRI